MARVTEPGGSGPIGGSGPGVFQPPRPELDWGKITPNYNFEDGRLVTPGNSQPPSTTGNNFNPGNFYDRVRDIVFPWREGDNPAQTQQGGMDPGLAALLESLGVGGGGGGGGGYSGPSQWEMDFQDAQFQWQKLQDERDYALARGDLELARKKQDDANFWQEKMGQIQAFGAETERAVGMGNIALQNNQFLLDKATSPKDLFGLYFLQRGINPDWEAIQAGTPEGGDELKVKDPFSAYTPVTEMPDVTYVPTETEPVEEITSLATGTDYPVSRYPDGTDKKKRKAKKVSNNDLLNMLRGILGLDGEGGQYSGTWLRGELDRPEGPYAMNGMQQPMTQGPYTMPDGTEKMMRRMRQPMQRGPLDDMGMMVPDPQWAASSVDPMGNESMTSGGGTLRGGRMPRYHGGTEFPQFSRDNMYRPPMAPPDFPMRRPPTQMPTIDPGFQNFGPESIRKAPYMPKMGMEDFQRQIGGMGNMRPPGRRAPYMPRMGMDDPRFANKQPFDPSRLRTRGGGAPTLGFDNSMDTRMQMYADGTTPGYTTESMFMTGDARSKNPWNGGAKPELIYNPTGAPVRVLNTQQTRRALDYPVKRYSLGTPGDIYGYAPPSDNNLQIPGSNNSHIDPAKAPSAIRGMLDDKVPIPPALYGAVTGQSMNRGAGLASAFTKRGGGVLPSMQQLRLMSPGERENFIEGYSQGIVGIPKEDLMDYMGTATQGLGRSAVARGGTWY